MIKTSTLSATSRLAYVNRSATRNPVSEGLGITYAEDQQPWAILATIREREPRPAGQPEADLHPARHLTLC